jgi:pimeloyl-ACP methyl ester carboxylesterase
MRGVFVHGAGQSGAEAWPRQARMRDAADLVFVERVGFASGEEGLRTDFDEDRRRTVEAIGSEAVLIAHSYGAIAALMAAEATPTTVRSIVLFEPACLSLARGRTTVERHIEIMRAALGDPKLSDEQFLERFMASVGQQPAAPIGPLSGRARTDVRRMRVQRGPWEAELDPAVVDTVPTTVITSGSSKLSEDVAEALVTLGGTHLVWPGTGHRPQDDDRANALLRAAFAGGRPRQRPI